MSTHASAFRPSFRFRNISPARTTALALALAGTLAATTLAGCGLGKPDASTSDIVSPSISGKTFGGPNPIIGSTVKVYTTGNSSGNSTGYGVATFRQEANHVNNGANYPSGDTDIYGNFSFAGGYTCPAGQFAYITAAGGNTGASASASGATAIATWDGVISTAITSGGTLYTLAPTVTITPAAGDTTGSGATATATITSGAVSKITITSPGNAYTAPPVVTFTNATGDTTGSGAAATATAAVGGALSSLSIVTPGSGYLSATVTITPADANGSGGVGTPIITNGTISSITLNAVGSGYDAVPTVTISAPSGTTNPANNNVLLVAALGRCEDLYANTTGGNYNGPSVFIDELTTVAAAYALGHFSTVTGTGSSAVVSIGATATNNAAQISGVSTGCVAGIGACTTTAAAGLAHAFLNAANLVNVFQDPSLHGGGNTTVSPAYSTYLTSYASATPIVPQQLINSIGNSLVSCVNSSGGTAGDGTACGTLFTKTTLPAAISSYYTYTTASAPTNTFTAIVNLAANPTLGESPTNVAAVFNLASAFTSVYSPALTAAPNDYTMAILYPTGATTTGLGYTATTSNAACSTAPTTICNGLLFPASAALDINDIYYVANQSTHSGAAPINILALSSNGKLLGAGPNNATLKQGNGISVDATGYGYFANGNGSSSSALGVFTTGGGSIGSLTGGGTLSAITVKPINSSNKAEPYATAVDQANNVWAAGVTTSNQTLYESAAGGASFTGMQTITYTVPSSPGQMSVAVDPDQNIWTVVANTVAVLQNTGSTAALSGVPTYTNTTAITPSSIAGSPVVGVTFAGSPYVAYVSSYNTTPGDQPFTPTLGGTNGVEITALTPGTLATGGSEVTGAAIVQADGAGVLWNANTNNNTIAPLFNAAAGASSVGYRQQPCLGGSTTCVVAFNTNVKPDYVNIDSAGSIWVSAVGGSSATSGAVIELIGSAAPAWPLLSLGKQGQMP